VRDAPPEWSLIRQTDAKSGAARIELPFGVRLVAGRAPDAPVRLPDNDAAASRYHAAFEASTVGVQVIDLNSRNGVYVNDLRQSVSWIRGGDVVRLGNTIFRVEHRPDATADTTGEHQPFQLVPTWASSTAKAVPYRCELCSANGPVPAIDHEPWWTSVAWICRSCADARKTQPSVWPMQLPAIVGDFEILQFVARGGMGAVFEARHIRGGMRAAIKTMIPEHGGLDKPMTKRFLKEQRIATSLKHERIVRCFGVGSTDTGALYVATEFLAHGDAEQLASPRSSVRHVVALVADVMDGLAFAHAQGIVHRDIKPRNVLLAGIDGDLYRGKLADFGLAKSFRDIGGSILTKPGDVGGSAAFMAPEQLLGFRDVGPTADVYAAAAMLYYLLTAEVPVLLRVPLANATDPMLCLATLENDRVPIQQRRADVHPWLAQWIDLLVSRDHTKRMHIDAARLAATLWGFLAAHT
jgi:eukaryotic-like serine/threonine-protein kinase